MLWLFKINFRGFHRFLININDNSSYVVLYTQCLRYNICSAWFLDMRISTCCFLHCYDPITDAAEILEPLVDITEYIEEGENVILRCTYKNRSSSSTSTMEKT